MPGGDASIAAEINEAYAALKRRAQPTGWRVLPATKAGEVGRVARRRGRLPGLLMLGFAATVLLTLPDPTERKQETLSFRNIGAAQPAPAGKLPDALDMRLLPDEQAIASAVSAAQSIKAAGQGGRAAEFSRNCHRDLARYPNPAMLDHCVAFDSATALLGGGSAGPEFGADRMGERHARAAARISGDPVLAQNRVATARRAAERLLTRPAG